MIKFNIKELEEYREVGPMDTHWLENNVHEVDQLSNIIKDKAQTYRAISRVLDFVSLYPDLDKAGDWTLVRQIVLNESLLDKVHIKMRGIADKGLMDVNPKTMEQINRFINNVQNQINSMVKTLGTSRKDRRKDTREEKKIIIQGATLQELKGRANKGRRLLSEMESKALEADRKAISTDG